MCYIDISIYPPCRSINYYHTGRDIPKKSEIASYKACPPWRTAYSGATLLHELHKAFFLARSAKSVAKAHLQAADSHLQADSEWNLHILKGPCMNFCKLNTVTLNCSRRLCSVYSWAAKNVHMIRYKLVYNYMIRVQAALWAPQCNTMWCILQYELKNALLDSTITHCRQLRLALSAPEQTAKWAPHCQVHYFVLLL